MRHFIDSLPIRVKVLGSTVSVALLILLFSLVYFPRQMEKSIVGSVERRAITESEMVALGIGVGLELHSLTAVASALEWAKKDSALAYVIAVDTAGEAFASYNPHETPVDVKTLAHASGTHESAGILQVIRPIVFEDRNHGSLILGLSLQDMNAAIRRTQLASLAVGAVSLLLGILLAAWLSARIVRPLVDLKVAADALGSGDYDVRIHQSGSDELGSLSAAFASMVARTRAATDALRASERQFRSVAESARDAIIVTNSKGEILSWNQGAQSLFGYREKDVLGQSASMLVPTWYVESARRNVERVSESSVVGHRFEFPGLTKEGQEFSAEISISSWVAGDDRFYSGIVQDITERVAAREALISAREASDRATAAKSAFLANMSHEIRTPLNGIMGMVELLVDSDLSPEQRRSADVVYQSAESLLAIINDILDISKIEAGQLELEEIPFDLHGAVDSTVRVLMPKAVERKLELLYDLPPGVPHRVVGDPGRLRQILTNLIGNALKFTHEGEVMASVTLQSRSDSQAVLRFAVRDTGIGIPRDKIETIFEAFKQADSSTTRRYGGTGLGLSICRQLVRFMGGELAVTSQPGQGSEFSFTITLPVESWDEAAGASILPRAGLKDARVLVVDDNPTNRRLMQEILTYARCAVDAAPSGDAALGLMRRSLAAGLPYDLVVSDVHMPDLDGWDFAQAVRNDSDLKNTKMMLLTSAGHRGDGQRSRKLNIGAYLLKPISRVELLEAAAAVLGGSEKAVVTRHSIQETRRALKILLAEDNAVNQEVATAMLRRRGHRIDVVKNGREAVTAVQRERYDVVLMDIQMPELDGLAATREIRALPNGRAVPIIAVTANVMPGERERYIAAGMDSYIGKPFKAYELFAAIEGWHGNEELDGVGKSANAARDDRTHVDLEGLRGDLREAGIEDALGIMISTYLQDAPGRFSALEAAARKREAKAIESTAHAFKSSAATMRATALADALRDAETAGRSGNIEAIAALMERVRGEHLAVLRQLDTVRSAA